MKKTFSILSLLTVVILANSCRSSDENETPQVEATNALIGDWKISKYVFVDNLSGQQIGTANPECSGKNLYQLRANNFLNVRMYKNFINGACLDAPINDEGTWGYNASTKTVNFYGDADYKLKSISTSQLEIENFDEGYVDYRPKDYNSDGVVDKVITILIKQ